MSDRIVGLLMGAAIGFTAGILIGALDVNKRWEEKMIDRGYIEYKVCPETNEKILVDSENGEELDFSKE